MVFATQRGQMRDTVTWRTNRWSFSGGKSWTEKFFQALFSFIG